MNNRLLSLFISFLFLFSMGLQPAWADQDALKEVYLRSFNLFQKATAEKQEGNLDRAEERFETVREMLTGIQKRNPNWHKSIVEYLQEECVQNLTEISSLKKSGAPDANRQYRDYQRAIETYSEQSQDLSFNKILSQKEQKINALMSVLEESKQVYESKILQLETELDSFKGRLSLTDNKLQGFERLNIDLLKQKKELTQKVIEFEKEIEEKKRLDSSFSKVIKREKDLISQQQILSQLVGDKEKTIQNLEKSYKQLNEIKDLNNQNLKEENQEMFSQIQRLEFLVEKERTTSQIKNKTYGEELREVKGILAQVKRELSQAEISSEEVRVKEQNRAEGIRNQIAGLIKERDVLRENFSKVSLQVNQEEAKSTDLARQIAQLQSELKSEKARYEKRRLTFDVAEKNQAELLADRDGLKEKYDLLVADYGKQNELFQSQIKEYKIQVAALVEKKDSRQSELRETKNKVLALEGKVKKIETENQKIEKEKAVLLTKISKSEEEKAKFEAEVTKASSDVAKKQEELALLQNEVSILKDKLGQQQQKQEALAKSYQAKIKSFEEQLSKENVAKEIFKKEKALLQQRFETVAKDKDSLNEQVKELFSRIEQKTGSEVAGEAKLKSLQKQIQEIEDEKESIQQKFVSSKRNLELVKKDKTNIETRLQSLIASQKNKEIELSRAKEDSKGLLSEKENETLAYQSKLKEMEATVSKIIEEKNRINTEFSQRVKDFQTQVVELTQNKKNLKEEVVSLKKEMTAFQEKNKLNEEKVVSLESEIRQYGLRDEKINATYQNHLDEFDVKSIELTKDNEKLAQEYALTRRQVIELKAEKEKSENKFIQFKNDATVAMASREKQFKELFDDLNEELRGNIADKNKEIVSLQQKIVLLKENHSGVIQELNASVEGLNKSVQVQIVDAQKKQSKEMEQTSTSLNAQIKELNLLLVQYKSKYKAALLRAEKRHAKEIQALKNQYAQGEGDPKIEKSKATPKKTAKNYETEKKALLKQMVQQRKTEAKESVVKNPKPVYSKKAIENYNRGVDFADKGEVDKAEAEFIKAIDLMPNFFEAHYNLGRTYVMQGKKEDAIQQYLKSLAIKEDADVYYGLGAIYWQLGEWAKVIQNWEDVLKLDPNHTLAKDWLKKARVKASQASIVPE